MEFKRLTFLSEIVGFIKGFFSYFFKRLRFFSIIFWVFSILVFELGEAVKKLIVRYMFWGRGSIYRYIVLGAVVAAVLVMPFTMYRRRMTVEVQAEENVYETFAQTDLLMEQGSVETLIPKQRMRRFTDQYTVQGGDTLGQIASYFGLNLSTLLWANDLQEGDMIQPGQVLSIPPGNGVLLTVKDGDSVASLASKYKATEQSIIEFNWLDYPYELVVGQSLFVPDGTMPEPPKPVIATTPYTPPSGGGGGGYIPPSEGRFLGWPVAGGAGRVVGCVGGYHNGIDIADSSWPTLVAAAPGVVVFAGCQSGSCPPYGTPYGGYGLAWAVLIDHGNGLSTGYGHMNQIYVTSGQYVQGGQAIGQMGASGTAYGVHVHFMVLTQPAWGKWTNPAPYMSVHVCGY